VIIKNLPQIVSLKWLKHLSVSQINLEKIIWEEAQETGRRLFGSRNKNDQEFAQKFILSSSDQFYRIFCLFSAVGTVINVFEKKVVVDSAIISKIVKLSLDNHHAFIKKDPNPSDRYYLGEWLAFTPTGFLHQAAMPLAKLFGYEMKSVVFEKNNGINDLLKRIKNSETVGICLSEENSSYMKNRHGNVIKTEAEKTFFPAREKEELIYKELLRSSHLISLFGLKNQIIVADSFDIPIGKKINAQIAYSCGLETIEKSITGKALLISKKPIEYLGESVEMRLPSKLLTGLNEINFSNLSDS
jgi:hypothetical protein